MSGHEKISTRVLPGFMDLLPAEQILLSDMKMKIQNVYERYGFIPLDTPVIERAEVLLAKAGGETEKQIYRFTKGDNDLALRFDLTVPLARYVSEHFHKLTFPFRRYAIGKVYRGERPQRGRFREFYQCDIDIIGHGELNLINDAEIPSIIYATFLELGFHYFTIKINNRKILNGLLNGLDLSSSSVEILRIIDKINKITQNEILSELLSLGITESNAQQILEFIYIKGNRETILTKLKSINIQDPLYKQGVDELSQVVNYITYLGVPSTNFTIDLSIARGLDYYTGTVYETILDEYPDIGSVCSGGRYDNLAEYYTDEKLPGVGISIGLTRLFDKLNSMNIIQGTVSTPSKSIIIPMDDDFKEALELATQLRRYDIPTEVYFGEGRIKKKLAYANKLGIPYAVMIGENEKKGGYYTVKDMKSGEQRNADFEEILAIIREGF